LTKLFLVRHGITEFNSTRRFAGYSDIDMSDAGYEQVEKLRDRLANEKIDAVYSSDLKRALTTAEVICPQSKGNIVACAELREMNYGQAEGLTFDEISRLYPEAAELITNFDLGLEFPDGEGFTGFIERTAGFLDRLKEHEKEQSVLIVSHSGPLRVLLCSLLGIDQEHWWQLRFDNASLSVVETYPRGAILMLHNDLSHLRADG